METKFEDSNIAQLGSVYDKALRVKRADSEPEWKAIQKAPGLYIWRIEKFNVVPWPKEQYGSFYQGDTYIVLSIKKEGDSFIFVAHMWVGNDTTSDESGTGAYKIVELDDFFERKVTLIYEAQGYESKMFVSYFTTLIIMDGGIESGFKHIEPEKYKPRLFHVRGEGSCVCSKEVPLAFASLNNEDVFILDTGLKLFNWRGMKSSNFEKYHGTVLCNKIKSDRQNKPVIVDIEQGEKNEEVISYIKDLKQIIKGKEKKSADLMMGSHQKMMKISDEDGQIVMTEVPYSKDSFKTEDAFLIDRGDTIFVWVGKMASHNEKRYSVVYAAKYIVKENRNVHIPIISFQEGQMQEEIELCFK